MKKRILFLLLTIIALGAVLRFFKLGDVPVGFHRDEAILAVNGYSILKTGRDISGDLLPLHLRNYIYSPAGYSYASIPFILVFGLNPFSSRFASAFFGTLTILLTFFLVRILLKNKYSTALLSAFVLAISPWHINLSRTATENTLVVFFITLGTFLYLLWAQKKSFFLLACSYVSFALTLAIYQAPRAFLPMFIPLLFILYTRKLHGIIVNSLLYSFLIIIPILLIMASPNLSLRLRTVSIFGTDQTKLITNEQIREDGISRVPLLLTRLVHNKVNGYSEQFINNYFSHFSYSFLFTDSASPIRYKIPGSGILYLIEIPFIIAGMWFLAKETRVAFLLLSGWILLAPVGSALTFDDVPNVQRTLIMQPAISILIAYGLSSLQKFKKYVLPISAFVAFLYLIGISLYLHNYYVHQIVHQPYYRNEGYKALVAKVNELLPAYKKAVITNRETAPTIFFLFFGTYDPAAFQANTRGTTMKDFDRINFGKYEFTTEECPVREMAVDEKGQVLTAPQLTGEKNVLYVNYATCKTPNGARTLDEIERSDGTSVFKIVAIQ